MWHGDKNVTPGVGLRAYKAVGKNQSVEDGT